MKTAPGYRRGYIELRDWDIKSHEHLAEFKTWADRRGGVPGQLGKSLVFFWSDDLGQAKDTWTITLW